MTDRTARVLGVVIADDSAATRGQLNPWVDLVWSSGSHGGNLCQGFDRIQQCAGFRWHSGLGMHDCWHSWYMACDGRAGF